MNYILGGNIIIMKACFPQLYIIAEFICVVLKSVVSNQC
jgi:hypothetical protein